MADVGACFKALLAQPTIRRRLAVSGGLDDLDNTTVARLCVFAALHDIGKVNVGFQTRIWQPTDTPAGQKMPPSAGHIADLTPVLNGKDEKTSGWFLEALGCWDEMLKWDDTDGHTACGLFVASLSHHGRPLQLDAPRYNKNPVIWRDFGELSPRHYVERIGRLVREWFPAAWTPGAPLLPSAPAFQHTFLGLCMLADWIGSDQSGGRRSC